VSHTFAIYQYSSVNLQCTVFARVICALFSILVAEKSGCIKYEDFCCCGGLDLGFILA
jgi:hypothetical protein